MIQNLKWVVVVLLMVHAGVALAEESVAKQFLKYQYGQEVEVGRICSTMEDVWMLKGPKNTNALAEVEALKLEVRTNGILSGVVGTDMYFVELREGKVDPAFNLDGVKMIHRKMILMFLYSCLQQDKRGLKELTTDAGNVKIIGPKAGSGDMDQYGEILSQFPVVRSSKPEDDSKSQSVTYRVPLGEKGLSLTLVKQNGSWKIDTSKNVEVSLKYFFE